MPASVAAACPDTTMAWLPKTGARALLLCTSFGARHARKAYLWLDLATRYDGPSSLREGHEIRFLWQ